MDQEREIGLRLNPKFDSNGLITAVVTDINDGAVLMVGYMDAEAITKTQKTGRATFYSRSRQQLWTKGESSGHFLNVVEMRVDCDQDAIWIIARPDGPTCHTNATSCFYRKITREGLVRL
jgi:phosphoribosyl-AMP cyclohydrolase